MLVACYAYEGMYQGLHGIETMCVMEVSDNLKEAIRKVEDWGSAESEELIYSFGLEEDYLDDDEDGDITESIYYCDRGWYAHKIKDTNLSVNKLDEELCHLGMEEFVEKYCEKETLF